MSILSGVPRHTLQDWLHQAQLAYQSLMVGGKAITLTYGMGDGQKSVTYARAEAPKLMQWINTLQIALKVPGSRRRAIRPVF